MAVCALCPQGVGHFTGVFPSILQDNVPNDQELVARGKVMPFCHDQGLVTFQPGNAGRWAPCGFALKSHSLTYGHYMVFQRMNQRWCLCRRINIEINSRGQCNNRFLLTVLNVTCSCRQIYSNALHSHAPRSMAVANHNRSINHNQGLPITSWR